MDYQPTDAAARLPNPAFALLMCSPGAYCWFVYLTKVLGGGSVRTLGLDPILNALAELLPAAWLAAVVTASISIFHYFFNRPSRRAFPLPVLINLTINTAGLLFTTVTLVGPNLL